MTSRFFVVIVVTSPVHDSVDNVNKVWIVKVELGISWNVESIQLLKELYKGFMINPVINWNDTGSSSLEEVNMT